MADLTKWTGAVALGPFRFRPGEKLGPGQSYSFLRIRDFDTGEVVEESRWITDGPGIVVELPKKKPIPEAQTDGGNDHG